MIRALIFDIGNVLLRFDFSIAIRRLAPLCGELPEGFSHRVEAVKNEYEAGRISRQAFLKEAFALLEYRGREAEFIAAWEEIFEENRPVTGLLPALAERYPLYLLSNTSDIHVDYMLRAYPFFGHFRDAVYSYRVGCSKPHAAIYEQAARQFGIAPQETVFIDDLPANIETARGLGFHAIAYDFRRHEALETALRELKVL